MVQATVEFHQFSSFHPIRNGIYTTTVVTSPKKVYGILGSLAGELFKEFEINAIS